jgi:hypothetical protein
MINHFVLRAQTISGIIINENQIPIEYASIVLLDSKDSTLITGTYSTKDGEFKLEGFSLKEKKIVQISCLGYATRFLNIETQELHTCIGEITLFNDIVQLKEFIISANVSPFSWKNNNLFANVSGSLLSSVGTAIDVIKNLPNVFIKNNIITIFGKGEPIIYINSKKQNDLVELLILQSLDIESVELITNPGAEFDAEGRSVLLIKKKQNHNERLGLLVSERLRQGHYFGNSEFARLIYNIENISFFSSYNHFSSTEDWNPIIHSTIYGDTIWHQFLDAPQVYYDQNHHLSTGVEWSISPQHLLGGEYQGLFVNNKHNSSGYERIIANDEFFDQILVNSYLKNKTRKNLFNVFYSGNFFKKIDTQINIDYIDRFRQTNQQTEESSSLENRQLSILSESKYRLFAGKLTFNYKEGKALDIKWGGEYNQISGSGFLSNPERYLENTLYTQAEKKIAYFFDYSGQFGKFHLQSGIRFERASAFFTKDSIQQKVVNVIYNNFFPNLSLFHDIGNTQMGLSFSRKIKRPPLEQLSNNNYYVNRFIMQKGNPYLQPEDIYQLDYNLKYKIINFRIEYAYRKNPVVPNSEINEDNSFSGIIFNNINYSKYQELNTLFNMNYSKKIWQSQLTIGITQPFFTAHFKNENIIYNKISGFLTLYNNITLPHEYLISVNFNYKGKNIYYTCIIDEYKSLDLGLRKSFFNKKLSFNLNLTDAFKWINAYGEKIETNQISRIHRNVPETRFLSLTISYNFNNLIKEYRGKNATEDDIKRI